jgi:hypothetical protein
MTGMVKKLSAVVLAAAVSATAACGTSHPAAPWVTPSSAAATPRSAAAPTPTFTDPLHGSTVSVVKLYKYDAAAHSAVLEPIVFMEGPVYCKKFKIKSSDPRCQLEYTTDESHTKITVPVVKRPRLNAWDDGKDGDCIGSPVTGSVCPVSPSAFARWLKENPAGFAAITTVDGTITKIAQMYTP